MNAKSPQLVETLIIATITIGSAIAGVNGLRELVVGDRPAAVHNEYQITNTTNNKCWLWCAPGGQQGAEYQR